MQLNTHLNINHTLSGKVLTLANAYAKISLKTTTIMISDNEGLVHGGFIFSAADFTAMATVNDPLVVLAKSETKFIAPVKVGDTVLFEGKIVEENGKRIIVEVVGNVEDKKVFIGTFYTAVLDKHVLS